MDATGQPTSPVLVNTVANVAGGVVPIADINQSNPSLQSPGPAIPDGTYQYTALRDRRGGECRSTGRKPGAGDDRHDRLPWRRRRCFRAAPIPACRSRCVTRTISPMSLNPTSRGSVEPNAIVTLQINGKAAGPRGDGHERRDRRLGQRDRGHRRRRTTTRARRWSS